jgi:hypothetical protein
LHNRAVKIRLYNKQIDKSNLEILKENAMAAQQPDRIVIDGVTQQLYSNPLEEYWNQSKKKRPQFVAHAYCDRGYIATWEIRNNQLYLIEVEAIFFHHSFLSGKKKLRFSIQTMFSNYNGQGVLAQWYTGKLRVPTGRMRWYVHEGYESRFDKETIISIEHGSIVKKVILDFENQKLTNELIDAHH